MYEIIRKNARLRALNAIRSSHVGRGIRMICTLPDRIKSIGGIESILYLGNNGLAIAEGAAQDRSPKIGLKTIHCLYRCVI